MNTVDMLHNFALQYVEMYNAASQMKDYDEQHYLRREAKRAQREIGRIVLAIDTLTQYGIKVS